MIVDLTSNQQATAIVLAGLTSLCISANAIIGVIQKVASIRTMRYPARTPPMGEEAAKTYATKAELSALRIEWRQSCARTHEQLGNTLGSIFDLLRQSETRNNDWQRGVASQLGSIHEALDTLKRKVIP